MREFLTFLTALAVLAVAQSLTTMLGVVLPILALMGVVAHPRRTLGLVAALGLLTLALQRPVECIAAASVLGIAFAAAVALRGRGRRRPRPAPPLLLPRPGETG